MRPVYGGKTSGEPAPPIGADDPPPFQAAATVVINRRVGFLARPSCGAWPVARRSAVSSASTCGSPASGRGSCSSIWSTWRAPICGRCSRGPTSSSPGRGPRRHPDESLMARVNVGGTRRVLEAARLGRLRKGVLVSSAPSTAPGQQPDPFSTRMRRSAPTRASRWRPQGGAGAATGRVPLARPAVVTPVLRPAFVWGPGGPRHRRRSGPGCRWRRRVDRRRCSSSRGRRHGGHRPGGGAGPPRRLQRRADRWLTPRRTAGRWSGRKVQPAIGPELMERAPQAAVEGGLVDLPRAACRISCTPGRGRRRLRAEGWAPRHTNEESRSWPASGRQPARLEGRGDRRRRAGMAHHRSGGRRADAAVAAALHLIPTLSRDSTGPRWAGPETGGHQTLDLGLKPGKAAALADAVWSGVVRPGRRRNLQAPSMPEGLGAWVSAVGRGDRDVDAGPSEGAHCR